MVYEQGATFPTKQDAERKARYDFFEKLWSGQHFDAFLVRGEEDFSLRYARLRYIVANFPGLISKVIADLLFGEELRITLPGADDKEQKYLEALIKENQLNTQNYESALGNSRRGDAVYRCSIRKRNPGNPNAKPTVIIEDVNPAYYYPKLDPTNVRQEPQEHILAWIIPYPGNENKSYIRQEIHTVGKITHRVFDYDNNAKKIGAEITDRTTLAELGIANPVEQTKIDDFLIIHVPNWRDGTSYFGKSDYFDLETLFFAINNRLTKIDNILDKHSDPILAVPEGVIGEDGKVRKEALGLIEVPSESANGKPEYIIWDANLEAGYNEIERLIDTIFLISETAPAAMGLDKGGTAESGRALKFKLIRTLAKKNRKQLYYDAALKRLIVVALKLAKAWQVEIAGLKYSGEPREPVIDWPDGVLNDSREMAEEEEIRLRSGTTSRKRAIMRLDGLSEKEAEEQVKEIDEEDQAALPEIGTNPVKPNTSNMPNNSNMPAKPAMPMMPNQPKPAPKPVGAK